jgi:hypothetical protein
MYIPSMAPGKLIAVGAEYLAHSSRSASSPGAAGEAESVD